MEARNALLIQEPRMSFGLTSPLHAALVPGWHLIHMLDSSLQAELTAIHSNEWGKINDAVYRPPYRLPLAHESGKYRQVSHPKGSYEMDLS